jgi:uncharacterized protein YndB with AHSA1/START domain
MSRSYEKKITIAASPAEVWRALTDGEKLRAWFAADARVTPGAGGQIWMSWGPGFEGETKIQIWEENRHLRTGDPKRPVAVDYLLEGKDGSTTLRLVQSFNGDGDWDDEYNSTFLGWTIFLDTLKVFLEERPSATCRQACIALPVEGNPEEVIAKVLGVRGAGIGLRPAGEPFVAKTALGDELRGKVVFTHEKGWAAELTDLDTRVYLTVERTGGGCFLFFCLLVYAQPAPKVDLAQLEARFRTLIEGAARS